ncbi:MAG: ABC transporter ATP-binding protein [Planctomycetota bacterium]
MIRVENLTHHYGVRPVLLGVTMEIADGELVVLLGPNGMGKTTLLGCLAGVLWPHSGFVEFDGVRRRQSTDAERGLRRRIAYLPDTAWLPPLRTGREHLLAMGRLYGHDDLQLFDHSERLLRLFHLEERADSPMSGYSTGQQKKIALAGALITEAPYLLLDEPFSGGLDPAGILAMKSVLKRLASGGQRTIVLTTPVPELVEELAGRVAIIQDGRLTHYDTPAGLRATAGTGASLDDALQQLVYPDTRTALGDYFGDAGRGPR